MKVTGQKAWPLKEKLCIFHSLANSSKIIAFPQVWEAMFLQPMKSHWADTHTKVESLYTYTIHCNTIHPLPGKSVQFQKSVSMHRGKHGWSSGSEYVLLEMIQFPVI